MQHFSHGYHCKRNILKAAAVSSCNLPEEISEEKIRKRKERAERCTKRAVFGTKRPRIAEDTIEMSISVEKQQEHLDTQQELQQISVEKQQ